MLGRAAHLATLTRSALCWGWLLVVVAGCEVAVVPTPDVGGGATTTHDVVPGSDVLEVDAGPDVTDAQDTDAGSDVTDAGSDVTDTQEVDATPDVSDVVEIDSAPEVTDVDVDVEDATQPAPEWSLVASDLPGAVLALWSDGDELWAAGAAADTAQGATLLRRSDGAWSWIPAPMHGHLWSVHGAPGGDVVYACGDGGALLSIDRASGDVTPVDALVDVPLRGLWAVSDDELWVVGGETWPTDGPGVMVHVSEGQASLVDLAELDVDTAALFGIAADDVGGLWAAGEAGTVLRQVSAAWSAETLGDAPLTAVSALAGEPVAVGGGGQARVYRYLEDDGWSDESPAFLPALGGVAGAPDGALAAVGLVGTVVLADDESSWAPAPPAPVLRDWRAVTWDDGGALWIGGGHLLAAADYGGGAIACLGEAGACDLAEVPELSPAIEPDAWGSDVSDVSDASDGVADDASDVGPELDVELISDVEDVEEVVDDPAYPLGGALTGDFDFALGVVDEDDVFSPLMWHHTLEIVQGNQGGIHLEVALFLELKEGLPAPSINLYFIGQTHIDGDLVGGLTVPKLPILELEPGSGVYVSPPLPLIFDENQASAYLGEPAQTVVAEVCVELTREDDTMATACQLVDLVDLEP